jgi:hypothetical protein
LTRIAPKGRLVAPLIGTPASGGQPDPAAGQTPVFCRAAEAFDGRFVSLRPWLIHVNPRHCSYVADAWATRTRGTVHLTKNKLLIFRTDPI